MAAKTAHADPNIGTSRNIQARAAAGGWPHRAWPRGSDPTLATCVDGLKASQAAQGPDGPAHPRSS
eukprot:gene51931-61182_t